MSDGMPRAVAAAMPAILAALPAAAPGLSTRQIHARLGNVALVMRSIRPALVQLERDGQALSELGIGARGQLTRFYRRADAAR